MHLQNGIDGMDPLLDSRLYGFTKDVDPEGHPGNIIDANCGMYEFIQMARSGKAKSPEEFFLEDMDRFKGLLERVPPITGGARRKICKHLFVLVDFFFEKASTQEAVIGGTVVFDVHFPRKVYKGQKIRLVRKGMKFRRRILVPERFFH
jgi:hypothetical protein